MIFTFQRFLKRRFCIWFNFSISKDLSYPILKRLRTRLITRKKKTNIFRRLYKRTKTFFNMQAIICGHIIDDKTRRCRLIRRYRTLTTVSFT